MRNFKKCFIFQSISKMLLVQIKNVKKIKCQLYFLTYDKNFTNGSYLTSLIIYWVCIIKSHLKTRCNKFQLIYMYASFPDGLLNNLSTDTVQSFIFLFYSFILHELSSTTDQVPKAHSLGVAAGYESSQKAGDLIFGQLKSYFSYQNSYSLCFLGANKSYQMSISGTHFSFFPWCYQLGGLLNM